MLCCLAGQGKAPTGAELQLSMLSTTDVNRSRMELLHLANLADSLPSTVAGEHIQTSHRSHCQTGIQIALGLRCCCSPARTIICSTAVPPERDRHSQFSLCSAFRTGVQAQLGCFPYHRRCPCADRCDSCTRLSHVLNSKPGSHSGLMAGGHMRTAAVQKVLASMEVDWDAAIKAVDSQLAELDKLLTQHAPKPPGGAGRGSGRASRSSTRSTRAASVEQAGVPSSNAGQHLNVVLTCNLMRVQNGAELKQVRDAQDVSCCALCF